MVNSCYGLCIPNERSLVKAKFESAGQITVQLSAKAASGGFPCLQLFDTSTQQRLGASSQCRVEGTTLTIYLKRDANIMPGQEIRLSGTQAVLRDFITPDLFSNPSSAVLVENCEPCSGQTVTVTVTGPKVSFAQLLASPGAHVSPCGQQQVTKTDLPDFV